MEKRRLFIATFADCERFDTTYGRFMEMANKVMKGKWVEPENLHTTFKFLGSVEEEKIPEIKAAVGSHLKEYDYPLTIKGLGVLPNMKKPNTLYARMLFREGILFQINKEIETALEPLGFLNGSKKYKPHMSFLRIKKIDRRRFKDFIKKFEYFEFCKMKSFRVNLISSELTHERPHYTIIG